MACAPVRERNIRKERNVGATERSPFGKDEFMPPEFYITCPKCGHRYNVHKMIYDEGEDFSMFCPVCTTRYPRKDGKIDAANFEIKK